MDRLVETLDQFVRGLSSLTAGIGLFVIAFFDSSLLSLPEVNDVLLVYFGTRFPANAFYYALMTMLGSTVGASLLYGLARWKGYTFVERRFSKGRLNPVLGLVRRYGVFAVALPSILPPPFPFKIFVLSSGAMGLPVYRFLTAIVVGRSVRYFGEAWLALRYGEQAIGFLRAHAGSVLVAVLALVALVTVVHFVYERRRRLEAVTKTESFELEEP
ncbi:MAG: YqaA family protein [Vicinamibacteria bacterium]